MIDTLLQVFGGPLHWHGVRTVPQRSVLQAMPEDNMDPGRRVVFGNCHERH